MIAHVALFWGPYARDCFKLAYRKEQPDPHYQVSMALFVRKNSTLQLDTGDAKIQRKSLVVVFDLTYLVILCR